MWIYQPYIRFMSTLTMRLQRITRLDEIFGNLYLRGWGESWRSDVWYRFQVFWSEIAYHWRNFADWQHRMMYDRYALVSNMCFGLAVTLLFDGYTFNLLGSYVSDSTEVALSYFLLLVAFLSLRNQYKEDHRYADRNVQREREEFLRKERAVSDIKTNIARDLKRERMSGSKKARYSAIGHRDATGERDSILDNFAERRSTAKFGSGYPNLPSFG